MEVLISTRQTHETAVAYITLGLAAVSIVASGLIAWVQAAHDAQTICLDELVALNQIAWEASNIPWPEDGYSTEPPEWLSMRQSMQSTSIKCHTTVDPESLQGLQALYELASIQWTNFHATAGGLRPVAVDVVEWTTKIINTVS